MNSIQNGLSIVDRGTGDMWLDLLCGLGRHQLQCNCALFVIPDHDIAESIVNVVLAKHLIIASSCRSDLEASALEFRLVKPKAASRMNG
jgi:hypothetical protein